jgi:L-alanine-DL-glutamate epimerase-like enolase superfamily enzyme
MKLKVQAKAVELPFQYPFTISKGTKTHQPTLIVELEYFGRKGYGEAPAINYYNVTVAEMLQVLEQKKRFVEQFALTDPGRFWHFLHHLFPNHPFLVCALDMAAWDVWGKLKGQPLYALWGLDKNKRPITDYTIGIDTPEVMLKKIQEKPWPAYKIKMGFDGDLEMITEIRKQTDTPIRIDVNEGWDMDMALRNVEQLKGYNIEFIEQPIKKNQEEEEKKLYKTSSIPIIADESCVSEHDVEKCAGRFHGINIKLTKCSGITPAIRMIKQAKDLGLKVMLGCMNESSIGTAALVHLSPMVDWLDADGPLLLTEDVSKSLQIENGLYQMPEQNGLGIEVDFNQL